MKDSGVQWIGEIPEDWEVKKLKEAFSRKNSKAMQEDPVVLSLTRSGIKIRDISNNEGQLAENYYNYNPVEEGDFLLNPMDLYSGANCNISRVSGVISPAYINLRAKDGFVAQYYDYYFKTQYWAMALFAHGKGVSFDNRWTLNNETLMNYFIPTPPTQEQQTITSFLSSKVFLIDHIIDKTKKSIEEYKKYKQSLITETVTKGLNPDVEMKDSGIEWIGEIPEHWEIVKIKHLSPVLRGASPRPIDDPVYFSEDGEYVWTRISDVSRCNMYFEKYDEYMSDLGVQKSVKMEPNELFVSICATVGKPIITKVKCCIHDGFVYFPKLDNKYNEFLYYIFNVGTCFVGLGKLGTQLNLNTNTVGNIYIPLMPELEKNKIVRYISIKSDQIDNLITKKQQLITELESYKKSLIYEYVTGKKQVI